MMDERPELATRLKLHLNGGSKYSERHEEVLADGEPTGITMHTRTNGRPEYRIVAKELHHGEETFDVLEHDSLQPAIEWIYERLTRVVEDPENGAESTRESTRDPEG